MATPRSLLIETDRLRLREATPEDLPAVHGLFAGNPDFIRLRRDISDHEGGYDREAVRDYCQMAMLDPTRHLLAIDDLVTSQTVGIIDFVEASPADMTPWIGLVLIDRSQQRIGLGSETVAAVVDHLKRSGARLVRMAVIATNDSGLRFARSVGFDAYGTGDAATASLHESVILTQARLGSG